MALQYLSWLGIYYAILYENTANHICSKLIEWNQQLLWSYKVNNHTSKITDTQITLTKMDIIILIFTINWSTSKQTYKNIKNNPKFCITIGIWQVKCILISIHKVKDITLIYFQTQRDDIWHVPKLIKSTIPQFVMEFIQSSK